MRYVCLAFGDILLARMMMKYGLGTPVEFVWCWQRFDSSVYCLLYFKGVSSYSGVFQFIIFLPQLSACLLACLPLPSPPFSLTSSLLFPLSLCMSHNSHFCSTYCLPIFASILPSFLSPLSFHHSIPLLFPFYTVQPPPKTYRYIYIQ